MTDLLDQAVRIARGLPTATQQEIARFIFSIAGEDRALTELSADEEASLSNSLAQAARREFATDEQVRAVWKKHGL